MLRAAIALGLVVALLAGCGGRSQEDSRPAAPASGERAASGEERGEPAAGEGESEESERGALERVPARDRGAYYHLATAAGVVSEDAAVRLGGHPRRDRVARLGILRRQVSTLRPRDRLLRRLRTRLLALIRRASRGGSSPSADLTAAREVVQGLERYGRSHPAVRALVPE